MTTTSAVAAVYPSNVHTGFKVVDPKGRRVGVAVARWMKDGAFCTQVMMTRDGQLYGSSQPVESFDNMGAAEAYIVEKLENCRKRAVKKFPAEV